jgi:glycosyltransferase involved in cell wall biosynthesis
MKILHVANMNTGEGVASFIMNYYRYIDREKIQFDFLSHSLSSNNYIEEIRQLGGNVYSAPHYKKNIVKYIIFVNDVISNGAYDIIHCHEFLVSTISLFIARIKKIKIRIIHSHSNYISSLGKRVLVYLFRKLWFYFATDYFACSKEAAEFLFSKHCKYILVNNAINTEKFIFTNTIRNNTRHNLSLSNDAFVVGYVARFDKQKNHYFLIKVFKNIVQKKINAYLLLAGEGPLQDEIKKYAATLGISGNIIFYGISKKVYELYSAMDVFVFPSLLEGLGIVGIEAQCAGLPVIASTKIPKTMQITPLGCWLDLESSPEKWAEKVLEYSSPQEKTDMTELITQNGYNIKVECKKLEMEYFRLYDIQHSIS